MMKPIHELRENYDKGYLAIEETLDNPLDQFRSWFADALKMKILEPNAMTLSTVNHEGIPSARIVLLKDVDDRGLQFYTNYNSRKSQDISQNPHVALTFLWKEMERQVCFTGKASKLSREESEAYFQSRPKGSQIGAWVSAQSEVIKDRAVLDEKQRELEKKYADESVLPIPDHWGGFLVTPVMVEFWQGRTSRLHDRIRYRQNDNDWIKERLSP